MISAFKDGVERQFFLFGIVIETTNYYRLFLIERENNDFYCFASHPIIH